MVTTKRAFGFLMQPAEFSRELMLVHDEGKRLTRELVRLSRCAISESRDVMARADKLLNRSRSLFGEQETYPDKDAI